MKKIILLGTLCAMLVSGPAGAAAVEGKAPPGAKSDLISGKVIETMSSGGYTYVYVDTGAKKAWAAAPVFTVKVGDSVVVADAMSMANYRSKTLNRTFDVVYFSGNVTVNGKPTGGAAQPGALPAGHPPTASSGLPAGHPPTAGAAAAAAPNLTGIKRAENGQTVAEIITGSAKFAGKPIALRGRVVKFNGGIMGKNWLHIRDGSGAEGTNDLTVTTAAGAKVGDLVLVTGVLATNRNFGSGYSYPLIVEDAKVVVE
ncbi:MAG: hypothetical protein RIQ93_2836 [Verrucomicrobiota bacterium]|jgi:hypothetical protein